MSSSRVVRVHARDEVAAQSLRDGIAKIQSELKVTPGFAPDVEKAAASAAAAPRLPDLDRTDIPFVTIDPESSMDLDQALHIEREDRGYVVHYAIADVHAFVQPRRGRAPTSTSSVRGCGRGPSSTTPASSRRSRTAPPTSC